MVQSRSTSIGGKKGKPPSSRNHQHPRSRVTVLGAGVIGLTTAAGAHWRSFAQKDDYRLQEWDEITFNALLRLCNVAGTGLMITPGMGDRKKPQDLVQNLPLTQISCAGYEFWADEPDSWEDPFFARFIPKYKRLDKSSLPAKCQFGISYETVCINVPKYLLWLLTTFKGQGGTVVQRDVKHVDELIDAEDAAPVLINCTGYGARKLGGVEDQHVYPTRGQTVHIRAAHVRHTVTQLGSAHEDFTYIIPRDDGIVVLGGTYQANNTSLEPDPETASSIVARCLAICPELSLNGNPLEIVNQKVGLRPTRVGGTRCEAEWRADSRTNDKVLLVHNVGHGGYGYQSSYGCAATVLRIVEAEIGRRQVRHQPPLRNSAGGETAVLTARL
ncbi:hypothetical protein HKX48_008511 [Thoreauomyces humboldtii]|nr:hypothetical protein HKX48_008511 [Thoreauomyces humboldtii]